MTNSTWEGFSLSPLCKVLPFSSPRDPLFLLLARSSRPCRCAVLSLSPSRSLPLLVLSLCFPSHPCGTLSCGRCEVLAFSPWQGPLLLVTATSSFPSLRAPSLWPLRGLSLWPLRDLFFLVTARPFFSCHSEAFSLSSFRGFSFSSWRGLFFLVIPRPFVSRHCEAFSLSSFRGLFSLVIPRPFVSRHCEVFFSRHCEAFSLSSLRGTKCRSNLMFRPSLPSKY